MLLQGPFLLLVGDLLPWWAGMHSKTKEKSSIIKFWYIELDPRKGLLVRPILQLTARFAGLVSMLMNG